MELSGKRLARAIINGIHGKARTTGRYVGATSAAYTALTLQEHRAILAAVQGRDSDRAASAMYSHIVGSWARRRPLASRCPVVLDRTQRDRTPITSVDNEGRRPVWRATRARNSARPEHRLSRNGLTQAGFRLLDDVELDPIEQRVVLDRAGVSGAAARGLAVGFPGTSQVRLVDRGERNQFDRIDLDLSEPDPIPAASLDLRFAPQPERDRHIAGQHVCSQLPAELHGAMLFNRPAETAHNCILVPL